jgi:hypothetical protein
MSYIAASPQMNLAMFKALTHNFNRLIGISNPYTDFSNSLNSWRGH